MFLLGVSGRTRALVAFLPGVRVLVRRRISGGAGGLGVMGYLLAVLCGAVAVVGRVCGRKGLSRVTLE